MATQQEVIQKFMAALDNTTLKGTAAVDEAIRASSNFQSTQDVINSMISDCNNAASGDEFLKKYCGIILGNDDTGAITGSDAGGSTTKTAESIVPEEDGKLKTDFKENFFEAGELTVKLATGGGKNADPKEITFNDLNNENERFIWQSLRSYWIESGLNLIAESYGNNFTFSDGNSSVKTLYVIFDYNMDYSTRAKTFSGPVKNQKCTIPLELHINMNRFSNLSGINGGNSDGSAWYLDRTIAHELTHAVMMANVDYFFYLPQFIAEGMADLTNGIDDKRKSYITDLAKDSALLKEWLDVDDTSSTSNYVYSAGYMFLRYLAKQSSTPSGGATEGNDNLNNTLGGAIINALGGNDTVYNSGDYVRVNLGTGNDSVLNYGVGATLCGESGNNDLSNRSKNVSMVGGTGNDSLWNEPSTNSSLSADNVTIVGNAGNDSVNNFGNKTRISVGTGNDTVYNYGVLYQNDSAIFSGVGKGVKIYGGSGSDVIINTGDSVTIDGGNDNDTIQNGADWNGTYGTKVSINGGNGNDSIKNIRDNVTINGGDGNDNLSNSGASKVKIYGGSGNDSIYSYGNKMTISADSGNDYVMLYTDASNATVNGGSGNDEIYSGAQTASINAGDGNDYIHLYRQAKKTKVLAGSGNDTIVSYGTLTTIDGGKGNDSIKNYATSTVTLKGGSGADHIANFGAAASIVGGDGNDSLYGDAGKDTLKGGANNDRLYGYEGNDKLSGGTGNDKLYGNEGNDTLSGDSGNDSLWGNAGADTFIYSDGDGKDVIYGFENDDMLKITGTFSTSYSKSKGEVYFKVGNTSKAITLRDFDATTFNVNGSSYKISGTKLVKK